MNETHVSVENFDLERHAVVDASAGTGKTYTIENLVLRLLTVELVPIEQILIVTFTEKATGELKSRLRRVLDRGIDKDDAYTPFLKRALDHFDQAPIFTIHGFCQRLAQEYALEQGQDFNPQLVDDPELLRSLLSEIQRKEWRTQFGNRLKAVLENAMYNRETAERWDGRVLEIARKYKPRCDHRLRPAFVPDWWQRLDEPDVNWAGQLQIFTIGVLHKRLHEHKRQRGMQSFDDMIAAVEEALDPFRNQDAEESLQTLRRRYRYGIVDEFQDTDPLQWRIFRRIFLDGGDSKLFVVGDPKQAIYGFRGADLPTYVHAAREMRENHGASDYPLNVNWRSEPDLLEALNCVYEDGAWFAADPGIPYHHLNSPDEDKRLTRAISDRTARAALTILDTSQRDRLKAQQKLFANFIAHETRRLLARGDAGPLLTFIHQRSQTRPLNPSDICILVLKRREAEPITEALDSAGIPYSFYKQASLWQSDAAFHFETLLQALARPTDRVSLRKALLTCFFRLKAEELVRAPDVPVDHPAHHLFQTWLGYAQTRAWSALCRSVLEDTGLLFAAEYGAESTGDGARRLANLRRVLAAVEQAGHAANLDLIGMCAWLRDRRQPGGGADDADYQPSESGRPKVKIMTIHASKGLEFPVVFLAGGFTQRAIGGEHPTYRDDQDRLVFDFCPDDAARVRMNADLLANQRRLLYVAMTRAIFKLYVPKIRIPRRSTYLGPLGTVLLPALEQSCPDKLPDTVAQVITPTLAEISPPAAEARPPRLPQAAPARLRIAGPLFPVVDANLGRRRIVTRSFSSMTRHHLSASGAGSSFGDQVVPTDDESATPLDRDDPLRGPVFGEMVHGVLERIDFEEVAQAAAPDDLICAGTHARRHIDDCLKGKLSLLRTRTPIDQLADACRQQIAQLVWHALRTPLSPLGCRLCDIPAHDRRAEIEFLYPEGAVAQPEERFITGFMDLLFRREAKYYLLDWKTNLLPGYGTDHIARSMTEADYPRQYRLYIHAVKRWLERMLGSDVPFLERFGGIYYLFVRGMNGRDDSTGVYFHRPTPQEFDLSFVLK